MKKSETICLRDIAEKAGVSRMTVSKALRGTKGVSPATRERIRALATEMGYQPNPQVAKAMAAVAKTGRGSGGDRLAFLTTHSTADGWKQFGYIKRCFHGALERAQEYGYELKPFWAFAYGKKLGDVLYARGIDGILLAPTGPELMEVGRRTIDLDWNRFSVVEIDEQLDDPQFRVVRHDHFKAMLETLYRLESLGYRRIGLALSRKVDARNRHRWSAAYLLWASHRNHREKISLFLYDELDPSAIHQWVTTCQVDAVVGLPGDFILLQKAGFSCPGDLGFSTLDLQDAYGLTETFSGMDQHSESIGVAAINLLVGMVRIGETGEPPEPAQLAIAGSWVDGETTHRHGPPLSDYSLYKMTLAL
jgi:LacI family transcriptional regulator